MGPPSYMQYVSDRNVIMQRMTIKAKGVKCLLHHEGTHRMRTGSTPTGSM